MVINKETKRAIDKYLNLPGTGCEQDWELELADKSRLNEFIDFLINGALTEQEKYALFSLIIASYNDFISDVKDTDLEVWTKILEIINKDKMLYIDVLNYWALWHEKSASELFQITPLIRSCF